jgi:hypothetical protein
MKVTIRLEASVGAASAGGAAALSERESARYLRLGAEIMLVRVELQGGNNGSTQSGRLCPIDHFPFAGFS